MPTFRYEAVNTDHKTVTGTIDALSRQAAVEALTKDKLRPLSVKQAVTKKFEFSIGKAKVKSKDLVMFTRQLSTMVSAGVPILRSLTTLQAQTDSKRLKEILASVNKDVQGGMNLGDAFAKYPDTFSDIFVNMVRAGEAGGILDDILKKLALQQEKNESIRKKVKGAMTYPTVLIVITILAFFGLMIFVIPQIGKIVKDLSGPDAQLPGITQVMLGLSGFMQQYWWLMVGAGVVGGILFRRWQRSPRGKSTFHHFVLKIPAIGNIVRKLSVARFAETFSALQGAGVSVIEALHVTARAVGNKAFEEEIMVAADGVKNGKQLSEVLTKSKLFPEIVPQMLAVGEETGQTDTILLKVAEFYEEEVDTLIGSLSSIIEPVMIVIMGSMVGLIAASVMEPIASLSQNIK